MAVASIVVNYRLGQSPFNCCKAHDIDSGRTRVSGRREHDDIPLPHMVAKGKSGFIPASVNTTMTNNSHINLTIIQLAIYLCICVCIACVR